MAETSGGIFEAKDQGFIGIGLINTDATEFGKIVTDTIRKWQNQGGIMYGGDQRRNF